MSAYLSIDECQALLKSRIVVNMRHQTVPLMKSQGHTLAQPIYAQQDWPPYARAAMDGYAFKTGTPGPLTVVGILYAGSVWPYPLQDGEALRIMTGAAIPDGANTVIEQERVKIEDASVIIPPQVMPGRNIMPQGHEYPARSLVLQSGTVITPITIGQLASLGETEVVITVTPRVLVLTTGDELDAPGTPLQHGHIFNSNGPLLQALLSSYHAQVKRQHVADNPRQVLNALNAARKDRYDLILTTGSVSVGDHDYLPELLETHFDRLFWRVDMHPGKAMASAMIESTPLIALSGNPGAMLTAWYLIVAPIVAFLTGRHENLMPVTGRLARPYTKATRETRFLKSRFIMTPNGIVFDIVDNQSSDALQSFAEADGLVIIPRESPPKEGGALLSGLCLPRI